MTPSMTQIVVTALLSSTVVGTIVASLFKLLWTPETKNDLARLGNEFAKELLDEARSEREELRTTIKALEGVVETKKEVIGRLYALAEEKDSRIEELEARQVHIANKLQLGQRITLQDVFGAKVPKGFSFLNDETP